MVVRKSGVGLPPGKVLRPRKRHFSLGAASKEAERLATSDPGVVFAVVETIFALSIKDGVHTDVELVLADPAEVPS